MSTPLKNPTVVIALLLAMVLAACGGQGGEVAGETPLGPDGDGATTTEAAPGDDVDAAETGDGEDAAENGEAITITWWDYFGYSPQADGAVTDLIARYEQANPDVTIERTAIGFGDFKTNLLQAAATGQFPDIAAIDNSDIPVFAGQGALADLTEQVEGWAPRDQFLPMVLDSAKHEDRFYGVPFRSNTTALWYNQDLFDEAGISAPPSTWEELRETAAALTTPEHSGFCFAAPPWEEATFTFLPMLWQAGGDVDTIGDEASVEALEFTHALVREDGSAPESILNWGQTDIGEQFGAGLCAMMVNGPWVLPSVEGGGFEWDVAPWPSGPAGTASPLGGEHWVVGADSEHVSAVWDLIEWLSDPANSAENIGAGLSSIPNRTDTIDDPAWKWHPMVDVFAEQMSTARPRGVYGERYAEISEAIWTMVQQVLTEEATPQEAASTAGEAIQPLLP